jgi:rubredoxin
MNEHEDDDANPCHLAHSMENPMLPKRPKHIKPASNSLVAPPAESTPMDLAHASAIHGKTLPGVIYGLTLAPMLGAKGEALACGYARDAIDRMAPRDAAEEMLVTQLLLTHARVMHLSMLANNATQIDQMRTLHEYADRASNTYRRLMLALAEYRRPPRTGDTFAIVKQANIGGQQVIQNHENSTRIATNEQGSLPNAGDARLGVATDTNNKGIPDSFEAPVCGDIDFNNDGFSPDSLDLDAFISRLGGGPCLQ